MLYQALHNRWLRLLACLVGDLIMAASLNLFIVPLNLYSGGMLGFCQLLRTFLESHLGWSFGPYDMAGILYFLVNIPILFLAWRVLGRSMVVKTAICTVMYSVFYSMIPIPAEPIVEDYLTACLLGGILTGVGGGIILTCGGSSGGLDVVGLCLSKRGSGFTVGKFSLSFNAVLYLLCLVFFEPEVAIYSVIYNYFFSMVLDRQHQQNITVQALIFTREREHKLAHYIMEQLGRGVTSWEGVGEYTGEKITVLCVCLSKYEIEELTHTVHAIDPDAFLTFQEGSRVHGNFTRKLD